MRKEGYNPKNYYDKDNELRKVLDMLKDDCFNVNEKGIFKPIYDELLCNDYFFVMADYRAYAEMQKKAETDYIDKELWIKKSIINTARMGRFSSDRTIKQYADEIWKINPV
jgi:starch phosphorylase